MKNTKYHVYINSKERRLLISSLNDLRNRLIAEGKYQTGDGSQKHCYHQRYHNQSQRMGRCG